MYNGDNIYNSETKLRLSPSIPTTISLPYLFLFLAAVGHRKDRGVCGNSLRRKKDGQEGKCARSHFLKEIQGEKVEDKIKG